MKLTPLEIKQQQFEKSLRGYDVSDVQSFLTLVSNEYEYLITKNKELEDDIENLKERVKHYERVEEALHETLQTAKESMEQKKTSANLEARATIEKAEMEAQGIVKEANFERQQIRQSILRLLDRREEIIAGIQGYLKNAQHSVEQFSKDELDVFSLPKEERSTPPPVETGEHSTSFSLDLEHLDSSDSPANYPPDTDRIGDILDEID
ncbi:MAG: DivIVA domain-containing protein [Bacteroidota bacterium]